MRVRTIGMIIQPVTRPTRFSLLIALLIVLFFHDSASAQSKVSQIESLLQTAQSREQLNGSVLVSEKGRILYSKAFGYGDFAGKTPLRTDSLFELASVSKPFTALAIMILQERGKLSYEDRLTRYFPELPYPEVTIRHMLTHTAGLPEPEPFF
jgi:CubicO group peptidase (beta-lactamase class C family)